MLNELEESLKNVIWDSKLLSRVALTIAENCVPFYLARDSNLLELEQKLLALKVLTPLQLEAILNNVQAKVEIETRKDALYNSSLTNPFIYNYSVLSSENRVVLERFCDLLARDEAGITDFVSNVSQRTSLKELIDLVDGEGSLYRILKKNVLNISSNINLPSSSQESLIVTAVKKYLLKAYNDPKYSAPEVAASIRRAYRLSKLNIVDLSFFYDNELQDVPLEKPLFMDHLELKKMSIDLKNVTVVSSYDSPLRQELEKTGKGVVGDTNLYFSNYRRWTHALMTCYTFCYSTDRLPEAQYRSMFWWHLFRELVVFQSFEHLCLSDEWKLSSLEGISQSIYVDAVINLQDSYGKFITPIVLIKASGHAKKSITDQHKDYNKLPTIMSLVLLNQLKKMKNLPDEIRSRLCVFGIYISALQIQIFKMTVSGDDLKKPTFLLHLSRKWFFSVSDDDSCSGHSEALDLFYSNEKYQVSVTDQLDVPNSDTALSPIPSDDEGDDVNSKEEDDESDHEGVKKTAHKDLLQITDLEELASKLSVLESFGRSVKEYSSWLKSAIESCHPPGWVAIKKTVEGKKPPVVESSRSSHTRMTPHSKQIKMRNDDGSNKGPSGVNNYPSSPLKRLQEKAQSVAEKLGFHLSTLIHERDKDSHKSFVWEITRKGEPLRVICIKTSYYQEAPWYKFLADSGTVPQIFYSEDWVLCGVDFEIICVEYLEPFCMDLVRKIAGRNPQIFVAKECIHILDALKSNHLIHRDIKPSNLGINLSCNPPRIQLIDFEYCIEADEAEFHSDQSCGTKEYQADETLKSPAEYSFASDMFSMGRCLEDLYGIEIIPDSLDELIWNMFAPKKDKRSTVEYLKVKVEKLKDYEFEE